MTTKSGLAGHVHLHARLQALSRQADSGVQKAETPDEDAQGNQFDSFGVGEGRYWISFPKDYNGKTHVSVYDAAIGVAIGGIETAETILSEHTAERMDR